jgi:hypothetical protein
MQVFLIYLACKSQTYFKHITTLSYVDYVRVIYIYTVFVKGMISRNNILKTFGFKFLYKLT